MMPLKNTCLAKETRAKVNKYKILVAAVYNKVQFITFSPEQRE